MIIAIGLVGLVIIIWGILLARLSRERPQYKAYWNQRAGQAAGVGALYYVALGDSAAQGIGSSQPEYSYVGLVASHLATKTGRQVSVANLSVSGAKTADVIRDKLPALGQIGLPPDAVVTLEIGANNMGPDFDEGTFRSDMDNILGLLPQGSIVADIPYFGAGLKKSREPTVERANVVLNELINVHHMRRAELFDQTKNFGSWRDFAPDMFHPNNRGYRNWSKAFIAVIDK
jgi:acyl-CoA thioesterase-1